MPGDNILRFSLNGLEYALRGDKSPEQLQRIVDLVSEKVDRIKEVAPNYSAVRTSTLAALQLAEELLEAKEESSQMLEEAAAKNRSAPRKRRTPRRTEQSEDTPAENDATKSAVEGMRAAAQDVLFPTE